MGKIQGQPFGLVVSKTPQEALTESKKAGNEAKTAIVDSTAREVAIMIINIAVAIALFIVSKIILLLVSIVYTIMKTIELIKNKKNNDT